MSNIILPINYSAIPSPLKEYDQWACWRGTWDATTNKLRGKSIVNLRTNGHASHSDSTTWVPYSVAEERCKNDTTLDGLMFALTPDDPFVGVDIDHCIGPDGQMSPQAKDIIDQLRSYSERSPSEQVAGRLFTVDCRRAAIGRAAWRFTRRSDSSASRVPG